MSALAKASRAVAGHETASPYRRLTPSLLQSIGLSIWGSLESFGRRRAMRELHGLAERWQATDPELARHLRSAVCDAHAGAKESSR